MDLTWRLQSFQWQRATVLCGFISSYQVTLRGNSLWIACLMISNRFEMLKDRQAEMRWDGLFRLLHPERWRATQSACSSSPVFRQYSDSPRAQWRPPHSLHPTSTVARTPLIGISQLGHGHCLSSAVESLRLVNVELRSAQTADWAPTLPAILKPRFQSHRRHWFGFYGFALPAALCWRRQPEGTVNIQMQLFLLVK